MSEATTRTGLERTTARALVFLMAVGNLPFQTAEAAKPRPMVKADSPAAPADARTRVVVTDAAQASGLESLGARRIADYGSFRLYDVNATVAAAVRTVDGISELEAPSAIRFAGAAIDTRLQAKGSRTALGKFAPGERRQHIIQFVGPIHPDWYKALEKTGADIISYVPNYGYLVYGDEGALANVQALSDRSEFVSWDGPFLDSYRVLSAEAADAKTPRRALATDVGRYNVQLIRDPEQNATTLKLLESVQTESFKTSWNIGKFLTLSNLLLNQAAVEQLAKRPDVFVIEPFDLPRKLDERQNYIISGNTSLPGAPDWLAQLATWGFTQAQFNASNFSVNLSDSGVDNATVTPNHFGLHDSGVPGNPGRIVYNRLVGTPNGGSTLQGCDGHGNINSHIIGGFVPGGGVFAAAPHQDAAGFKYGRGVCPFVKIGSSVIFDPNTFTSPNLPNLESMAYNDGARISSNSWGNSSNLYGTNSQIFDGLVRDAQPAGSTFPTAGNQEMVVIFAAGNGGPGANTVGNPGTAKNVLTAGASENIQAFGGADGCGTTDAEADNVNDIVGFSSRGPTGDNRKKPDLMAPGTHVSGGVFQAALVNPVSGTGAAAPCFTAGGVCGGPGPGFDFFPLGQQWYTASSGTSHSTPAIAGAAGLLRQRFINAGAAVPSPAMSKALMMNAARYMTGVGANDTIPSNNQGMGELDLTEVFRRIGAGADPTILRDQVGADMFTATGQTRAFTGNVASGASPFRVTLVWTDPAAAVNANPALINDLDLTVTVGGNTYRGNVFTGASSVTGGAADNRNNVESVFVPAGVTGPFSVTVNATNIAGDGVPGVGGNDQDFAIVIYNATAVALPVIAAAGSSLVAEACVPPNTAIDPSEAVTVSLCAQNVGAANTTAALTGTLQASGGVTIPGGPQNYGVLVAGGPAVCRNFTFTAAALTCGSVLTASVQMQDGASNLGTVAYNFTTGTVSPVPATFTNATGITIPAGAPGTTSGPAAPYPSTVTVSGITGTVSRITVTINGFTQTFPDDVDIALVGPGGQQATVLSDAGGGTDILAPGVNLVFDDLAAATAPDGTVLGSGTFRPTDFTAGDVYPAPAPAGAYPASFAGFSGLSGASVNGTWSLFVNDDAGGDTGAITSWAINVYTLACCGGGGPGPIGGNNPTSTIISSSLNPSIVGQGVTFKAKIVSQAAAGTPSGSVQFRDGGTVIATVPLNLLGEATTTTSSLTVGNHTITAFYFGDALFLPSLSALLPQVVNPLPATTTTVTSSKNPSSPGQAVTFEANVTSSGGIVSGTVNFKDGGSIIGTGTLSSSKASFTTSSLSVGTHTITAEYPGSASFAASTSAALTQAVNANATTTALVSSLNPATVGSNVTLTATITATGTPTGTVTFMEGTTTLGSGSVDAAKTATFSTSSLSVGSHSITAIYSGDSSFATSTSAALTQLIVTIGGCTVVSTDTLCVQPNGRFTIKVAWTNQYAGNQTGVGTAAAITSDSGFFTFFSPSNIELVVKVLDGRSVNGKFWVSYGALSDVGYTITVTDTQTSAVKTYVNAPGNLASVTDTLAFAGSRPAGAVEDNSRTVTGDEYGQLASIQYAETLTARERAGEPAPQRAALADSAACTTSGGTLCLNGGRFSNTVSWKNYNDGATGNGTAIALTADSGYFWFFSSPNVELMMKVLDGRSVNGKFWVLYGSLTDVEFHLTVTDTTTSASKTYDNAAHNQASKVDINAF